MGLVRPACVLSCVALCAAGAVEPGPTFPNGIAGVVADMRDRMTGASVEHGDDAEAVAHLKDESLAALAEDLAYDEQSNRLAAVAFSMVQARVLKSEYVGGCPRDMSGCPTSWSDQSNGLCEPPEDYEGLCAATDVKGLSIEQKEDFAWKCRASWPCAPSCKLDFGTCPDTWENLNGLCLASCPQLALIAHTQRPRFGGFAVTMGNKQPVVKVTQLQDSIAEPGKQSVLSDDFSEYGTSEEFFEFLMNNVRNPPDKSMIKGEIETEQETLDDDGKLRTFTIVYTIDGKKQKESTPKPMKDTLTGADTTNRFQGTIDREKQQFTVRITEADRGDLFMTQYWLVHREPARLELWGMADDGRRAGWLLEGMGQQVVDSWLESKGVAPRAKAKAKAKA